ncbi:MAG: phosphatase PAP2 family protein [Elusimicrobia bacterium]|nr:phosphatase PAP2 family protein [Elusimicrobiota bacterium]
MKRYLLLFFAAALCACASSPDKAFKPKEHALYLSDAQLNDRQFEPAPAPGSEIDKADMVALHEWQVTRTPEQCAKAALEAYAGFSEFFGDITPFVKPMPAEADAFFVQVHSDTDAAVGVLKKRNGRERPFLRDASLDPCLGRIGGLSYPSGHATISRVYALILSELAPERRAQFLSRADEMALDRVIGGVHYTSDIEAGKKFGDILYADLMRNPAFRAKIDKMRAYLAK